MKFRRVWSFLLVVSMLIGMMPMHAHAEENHGETDYAYETMVTGVGDGTQEGVIVDETTFPDANFRDYILSQDYGADGVLTSEELSNVSHINVDSMNIADLTGIEYFTALSGLWCGSNQLTELDVSNNTAIVDLHCGGNQLTALDVSHNTALVNLDCGDNQLATLDVSNNTKLQYLHCSYNQLTELDVSHNAALTNLTCSDNQLTELNVSNNTALVYLYCSDNQIAELDVSNNTELDALYCYSNQLTALDVSKNTGLAYFDCSYNQLTALDVSHNTALVILDCGSNQLTELDVSNNTGLDGLQCSNNQLTELDVSHNAALTNYDCSDNQLTELNVSNNTALVFLCCSSNQLTELDVSKNTGLLNLVCGGNQLTELDVNKNTALTYLDCAPNQLTELDVSANTALEYLYCGANQLTELDVSKNTALTDLSCFDNNRSVSATENQFDLSTLPGFDISKASDWNGGSVNGNILTVEYETVTYTYDLGDGSTETFTLTISNFHVHIFEEIVDEKYLVSAATCSDPAVYYVSCACGEKGTETFTNGTTGTGNHNFEENVCNSCGAIEICEATFPDANFRGYITSQDYGADGVLTSAELRNVTDINASYMSIEDLTGIEYFTALIDLYCNDNQLSELDLSNNTALRTLNCAYNQLTALDVSNNTALTSLACNDNQLTELDVSSNAALEWLCCSYNQLTELDVSHNTALVNLDCFSNQLATLDVSKNTALQSLYCRENELRALNVSNNIALLSLDCASNQLTAVDVSKNTGLSYLAFSNNQLAELDVSKNTALTTLDCTCNQLTALDVSKNTALTFLNCSDNQLTALDVSKNTALQDLYCSGNKLRALNVSNNIALLSLNGAFNQLTAVDVSKNTALSYLSFRNNQLAELDVSKNTALTTLYCDSNQLTALDVSNNTVLVELSCGENQLTDLATSANTGLTYLNCTGNQLTVLDVSKNTALTNLACNTNQLTALDVSKNTALEYLYCYSNQLTALDVSKNTALIDLSCNSNNRSVSATENQFDLSTLAGFDISKASDWNGGSVNGNILTAESETVTYTYDLGNGSTETFTLTISNFHVHIFEEIVDEKYLVSAATCSDPAVYYISCVCGEMSTETFTDGTTGTGNHNFEENVCTSCGAIEICEATYPDANFRGYITSQDYGADGVLTSAELSDVTDIDVAYMDIEDLTGIEYFIALEQLYCNENQLTELDVSKNTALTYLDCGYNQLTELDVSNNIAVYYLSCGYNQLTALDVSKNTALKQLYFDYNQLTALDVSKNTALMELYCNNNQLTALDVSKNTALISLDISCNQLTALDVSKNTALTHLNCSDNQLTALDVSKNTALIDLYCSGNQLDALDVSKNTELTSLECSFNQLTALDVSKNTALIDLYCSGNQLTKLDVSKNTALECLQCYNNQLTELDVSKNTALYNLDCDANWLTNLDLSKNAALTDLCCNGNNRSISATDNQFDLSTLAGFDISKASDWQGGTVNGNILTVESETVTYTYDLGNGYTGDFTLVIDNFHIHTFEEIVDEQYLESAGTCSEPAVYYVSCACGERGTETFTDGTTGTGIHNFEENVCTSCGAIEICEATFPDAAFREYITSQDYGTDGVLTSAELSNVTCIDVAYLNVEDLTGIEYFTSLTDLYCNDNQLTELDVSKNTALTDLVCYSNQLTALDVSKNTALTYLDCDENQLTELDVSRNTALIQLFCNYNQLTALDVSKNTALTDLNCYSNQLTTLDVSKNTKLQQLYCHNNQLTALDVSKNIVLTNLSCSENELTALNVSKNTKLQQLTCYSNLLRELDVRSNTALAYLDCDSNQLSALDVSKNTALESLYCWDNQLTALDVSKNTALTYLSCGENQLIVLDVSKNTELRYLNCDSNRLSALDVSKNTALTDLHCNANQLTTLDVSKNIELSYLGCNVNQLTVLDVSKNTALENLLCWGNQLTALDVSNNTALQQLDCEINQLTSLDVSKNTALTELLCSDNIRSISATKNQFDLSTLAGFDISKASDWQGGTVNGTILTATPGTVTYTYDLGNGYQETFTLNVEEVLYITSQPTSVTAKVGETAIFEVAATGMDLTYQWQYKDPAVGIWYSSSMTGNKTASMEVGAITFRDGFQYRCKITDINGNVIYSNVATLTVKAGPVITTQPTSAYLKLNETATFKVVATGTNLTYQWEYMEPAVGTWYSSGLTGNKTAAVQVGAIVGRNNFQYRCKVTDGDGTVIYSDAVTLTVFGIKTQPSSAALKVNETANFKVVALGNGLTYQWQYKDPKVGTWYSSGLTGNKTSAVQVGAIVTRNGFQYRCKITDVNGNVVYSNAATLTVKSGPVITTQPTSAYLKVNEAATFKVVATGTDLTYQWQYKDPAVGTWYSSTLTGNKTSAVRVGAIVSQDGFQYRCKITDGDGIVAYSNAVTLTVFGIKTQPTSATVKLNEKVNFKVSAVGNGLTYQWQYINPSVGKWYNSEMTGSKTSNMTVEAIEFRNGFQYRCKITDSKDNVIYSNAATLTVKTGPSITTQPTGAYLKVSETANFKVVATGTNLTYQWEYKDPAVGTWHSSTLTGNKTATIQVGATVGRNNFQYRCKISDGDGNVVYSDAVTLTVFGIKTQPTSATAKVNETVTFKVDAIGNGLTYQWQYKNPSVGTWYNSEMTGSKTSVMTVEAITFRNNFQYRCKITDSKGNVAYSNAVTLTVKSGPSITTQPVSATAKLNETVTFNVAATGTGLTYQWQYMNPSVGKWYNSEMTGSKTSAMKVEAIAFRDGFQYRCKITDANGSVVYSNAVTLTVKSGPSITSQPSSVTAKLNETVTFKVVATGIGLTYQWQYMNPSVGKWYNSEMTGSKTSAMKVEAIAFRDGFQYRCKITDSNGNVIYSNAVTLTVKSGPSITSQPSSVTAKLNETVTFKVVAAGTGLTYQWQYMNPSVGKWYNSEMTGSKTASMTVEAIAFRNNFQYRCKITDANGNVVYSNAATLTVK